MTTKNPFDSKLLKELSVTDESNKSTTKYKYYNLSGLNDKRLETLPFSIRVLLEGCIRKCDNFSVKEADVEKILNWKENSASPSGIEIPFNPSRVLMQDFTGVPAVVDLAALRDAMKRLGGDPTKINPLVPVDLVIDHSIQVDAFGSSTALGLNEKREFERNYERFKFLKWGSKAFTNLTIVPPGSGIVHQVNLEYLARVVFQDSNESNGYLYPDTLVGTDSHTTMINGLGVLGWGVGGIEAEAAMLGQAISMVLPKVVGYELKGKLQGAATSTDLVLTITQNLRKHGVVGKFVEFYGEGVSQLSLADRATISNMCPEFGATSAYFPVDQITLKYLRQTGRDEKKIKIIEQYMKEVQLFVDKETSNQVFSKIDYSEKLTLDLATVVPCLAGPKRPHDRVPLDEMKKDFDACLPNKRGFKGFDVPQDEIQKTVKFQFSDGKEYELNQGSVVIAAITSCTNTSNPSVMLAAGLVAKKAIERGLNVKPYVKTSLSPGSGVVEQYLKESGLENSLNHLGFNIVGYGCMTCIGNSGELPEEVNKAISENNNLVCASVLSGNRNFEARVHPLTKANYLASPPLVVAYALAGTVRIEFDKEPIGTDKDGKQVFLKDIWPSHEEIQQCVDQFVQPKMFQSVYDRIKNGTENWNKLDVPETELYPWDSSSTYIHDPPFFKNAQKQPSSISSISDAYVLLHLGDSITTDHISPAGNINIKSPAAKYLLDRGVARKDFNSYGSRRGNDEVMVRGTFANTSLVNKLVGEPGPQSVYIPSGEVCSIFDAAMKYKENGQQVIVLGGAEYGSGSSRDWAAKGPHLLGVRAVIATSYERIHRSNLVGMGIIPLQFKQGSSSEILGFTGKEQFTIDLSGDIKPGQDVTVKVKGHSSLNEFKVTLRFDTEVEIEYFKNGGILTYVLRQILNK